MPFAHDSLIAHDVQGLRQMGCRMSSASLSSPKQTSPCASRHPGISRSVLANNSNAVTASFKALCESSGVVAVDFAKFDRNLAITT